MIGYNNIRRVMAAALLVFFTMPSTIALTDSYYTPAVSSMSLNGSVNLTDSNDLITLSLRDSDIKQVLRMFADKAGLNIVFHDSVNGKVTLDLVKTPINEAFNLVLQIGGLNYYKQGNVMIILSKNSADNAAFSKQEMMVFPVKYVSAVKIANFLNQNVFSMQKAGLSGVDAATVNSATNELIVFGMPSDADIVKKVIAQFDREPFSKTFTVNHTTPAEMANMICNLLLPSRGIGSGSEDSSGGGGFPSGNDSEGADGMTGGAAGVMTGAAADSSEGDGASELRLGEGIVACSVATSSSGSVSPFDVQNLSIAYYPQRGAITLMGGSEAQAAMIEKFIKDNDIKQPQAYLEVSIVELNEAGSKEFQNRWGVYSKYWMASFDGESVEAGHPNVGHLTQNFYPVIRYVDEFDDQGVLSGQKKIDYMMPFPDGLKVRWIMNYIVSNRKGRVLANPKILITNGQESVIDLTQDYVEKVTSEYLTSSLAGAGSTGTVQRTYNIGNDLGIKVSLMPFISPDGYVTLNITPQYATIADRVYALGQTGTNELVATLLSRRDLNLKNVRIKDGETLVLGGMIQETEQKTVHKIPFLGDLPLIGPIFRSSSTDKQKNELVIMITPKIINDDEGAVAGDL